MKKFVLRLGRLADKVFVLAFMMLTIFVCAIIADDVVTGWSVKIKPESLLLWVRYAARIGVLFVLMALCYYILRSIYVSLSRKEKKLHPAIDQSFKTAVPFMRSFHPLIGATALSILALHGYFVFYRIYGLGLDPITLSGMTTFTILLLIGIMGLRLRKSPANKTIRLIHRSFAFLLLAGFLTHRIIVKLLAG